MTDILIVGAGPVGLTLATELQRRKISFVIIDKANGPAPIHESRALAFNSRSQHILNASGVTKRITEVGHQIERVNICWHSQIKSSVELVSKKYAADKLIICPQSKIERLLIEQLETQNVSVQWNTALSDFVEQENLVEAKLTTPDGITSNMTARYLIGCDGAHSLVRKHGGYTFDGETDNQLWTLADAKVKDDRFSHTLTADLRPGCAFATMPIEKDRVRLIHNGPDLLNKHPFSNLCTDIYWESDFKVSYRLVKQYRRGRTFLCGDAAHIHSPVGGRGMNLGIEDAATLAYLFEKKREDEYSSLRRPTAQKVLKMTHDQTTQMNSSSWLSSIMKQFGPKLLRVPAVKNKFLQNIYGLDTPAPQWIDEGR